MIQNAHWALGARKVCLSSDVETSTVRILA